MTERVPICAVLLITVAILWFGFMGWLVSQPILWAFPLLNRTVAFAFSMVLIVAAEWVIFKLISGGRRHG